MPPRTCADGYPWFHPANRGFGYKNSGARTRSALVRRSQTGSAGAARRPAKNPAAAPEHPNWRRDSDAQAAPARCRGNLKARSFAASSRPKRPDRDLEKTGAPDGCVQTCPAAQGATTFKISKLPQFGLRPSHRENLKRTDFAPCWQSMISVNPAKFRRLSIDAGRIRTKSRGGL